MSVQTLTFPAVDGPHNVNIISGANTTISFSKGEGGGVASGMINIQASEPGSGSFKAITGISDIDLSAPEPQTIIDTPAARLRLTLSAFVGSADSIVMTITSWS